MKSARISFIIPCLNEAGHIVSTLTPLQRLRKSGHEIILVDGGSHDKTTELASTLVDTLITSHTGRAKQMNAGAAEASGDILCFVHADTLCPDNIDQLLSRDLCQSRNVWGRFDIRLSSNRKVFRIIEWFINKRSCLTGIATGDQGIFICRNIFKRINGYADIPLMEDIEISKRLRRISAPLCIRHHKLVTSSRRWESRGILRTVLLMWSLRLRYFFGESEHALAQAYQNHGTQK